MNVPANPPMERSEVTVKGETTSAISGAFLSSVVSYYDRMSKRRHDTIQEPFGTYHDKVGKVFPIHDHHPLCGKGNFREKPAALAPRVLARFSGGDLACRQRPVYFKKANHRHDCVGSQVGRTIVIVRFEVYMREIKDILQVVLELSDKISREFYDVSIAVRFVGGEMANI